MKIRLMLCGVALAMMMSTQLAAQVVIQPRCGTPGPCLTPVPQPTIVPIVETQTNLTPGAPALPLLQKNVTLSQGQMLHVFGRLEFTANVGTTQGGAGGIDYVDAFLDCNDPNGNLATGQQDIGQNFLGPNQAPGPSYPTTGHMVLYPSSLITAAIPGTYSCLMLSGADKPGWVVGRAYQGEDTTWLGVSAPIEPGDAFSWGNLSSGGGCIWQGPYIGSDGCLYLGTGSGSHGAASVDVFSPAVVVPSKWSGPSWSPATGPAFVDATALVQVTLCGHTSSCVAEFQSNDTTSVVVDTYFELDQLDAAGKPFKTYVSPTQRSTPTDFNHHYMIYHKLSGVPVYPSSNGPRFQAHLYVTWVSGSTAKIDGAQAVAFTTVHGQALPVPNVVGLTESAASNTLGGSGYAASVISKTYSTASQSSVLSQDPTAGIIELLGSPVNLTVSTGSVTVPKVITLLVKTAEVEIRAAGLVSSVSTKPGCLDPGTVLEQSPTGGSGAAPGSTVTLTVDSGNLTDGTKCVPQ